MARKPSFVLAFMTMASLCTAQTVFVNEIHYDNTGTDTGESIEIAGPAGTDLSGWTIILYNGANGTGYTTTTLTGVIPNQMASYGTLWFAYPSNGIQNGAPDGLALINPSNAVVQFLSYEGSFVAVGGPANGMTSTDIGVAELGTEAIGRSLQLIGTGTVYSDFSWTGPTTASPGAVNAGQTFAGTLDNPDASFSPGALAFGAIAKDATKDLTVQVLNSASSSTNLNITGLTFGGTDAARFSLQTALPINNIAPGGNTTLTIRYTPGGAEGVTHSASATLVSNDPNNPTLPLSGSSYLDVADLAAARAASVGVPLRNTGIVTVNSPTNGLNTGRNQLAVQDASGADGQTGLFIDDLANKLAQSYSVGDQLQNLVGSLSTFSGELQFTPAGPANLVGTGAAVAALTLTGTEVLANIESELILIDNVGITTTDTTWTTGTGGTGNNYTLNTPVGPISVIRTEEGSQIIGQPIPTGNFNVVGLCVIFNATGEIEPRFQNDVFQGALTRAANWALYE